MIKRNWAGTSQLILSTALSGINGKSELLSSPTSSLPTSFSSPLACIILACILLVMMITVMKQQRQKEHNLPFASWCLYAWSEAKSPDLCLLLFFLSLTTTSPIGRPLGFLFCSSIQSLSPSDILCIYLFIITV